MEPEVGLGVMDKRKILIFWGSEVKMRNAFFWDIMQRIMCLSAA
jgi:hypothetical protein